MTEIEDIQTRLKIVEDKCQDALDLAHNADSRSAKNSVLLKEVELRSKSAEHRIDKLESKIDTILDKLSGIGNSQSQSVSQQEKIRKNTTKVLATLITAIIINLLDYL